MNSSVLFVEERHANYTVATGSLGRFATKGLFAEHQRMHIDQWRGWAAAHLCRLEQLLVTPQEVQRLAAAGEIVANMLGDPQLIFRLGWCTAYHGRELRLAYRVCKVPRRYG